mmetsp:Transcript_86749/g.163592  ORF Transcript_86749/g.163592 Transcript_86749/m.163592 type:complete len:319 (+) Transcript_86749:62-1018(+)
MRSTLLLLAVLASAVNGRRVHGAKPVHASGDAEYIKSDARPNSEVFGESGEGHRSKQTAQSNPMQLLATLLLSLKQSAAAWNNFAPLADIHASSNLANSYSALSSQKHQSQEALRPPYVQRLSASKMVIDDDELSRALQKRRSGNTGQEESEDLYGVPLSMEDTVATEMPPERVVSLVFNVFQKESKKASNLLKRSLALLGMSVPVDPAQVEAKVDSRGHLHPGAFSSAQDLGDFLVFDPRYSSLALMEEWEPNGNIRYEDETVAIQTMRVRRRGKDMWEPMTCILLKTDTELGKAWRILAMKKTTYYDENGNLLSPR